MRIVLRLPALRFLASSFLLLGCLGAHLSAQEQTNPQQNAPSTVKESAKIPAAAEPHSALKPTPPTGPLPAAVITSHSLELPGRTLHFTAKAGAVTLSAAQNGS